MRRLMLSLLTANRPMGGKDRWSPTARFSRASFGRFLGSQGAWTLWSCPRPRQSTHWTGPYNC